MSGPKTSSYTLTPEQRKLLEEQRKIEIRKAIANENIKKNSERLFQISEKFLNDKVIADELVTRNGNDNGFSGKMSELQRLITPVKLSLSKMDRKDVEFLEKTVEILHNCISEAEKLVSEINVIALKNESELRSNLESAIDKGFAMSLVATEDTETSISQELHRELQLELAQMKRNTELPAAYIIEIEEAQKNINEIVNNNFLKNYTALTINPLLKKCIQFLKEYKQYYEEFESLYSEYKALCKLYNYTIQTYICSKDSIENLKKEILQIKENVVKGEEQTYINHCFGEVMEELGYSVLGSREVTKKSGRHFKNELYSYGEGTAINITYSSDGKIAMELGGIDSIDRLPESYETSVLCDAMTDFCGEFREIEKRLAKRGVVPSERILLLPPNAEYAQIINTSEYKMEEYAESLQIKKKHQITQETKYRKVEEYR